MASQGGEGSSDSKMDHGEWKIFNDSVHGNMEFHPLCVAIIDTPEFQRLRYLKQLGVCYFVYPGASHNRFEHCLGVCYLAGLLVKRLQTSQPELDITEEDVLCVMIAGLCHDLGHGPFSHLFDKFIDEVRKKGDKKFIPKGVKWTHEKASKDLFDHMVKDEKLKQCFEEYKIGDGLREFIKELICGKPEVGERKSYKPEKEKPFLYEIVANKRNEVDVDKMDYFKRDALHLGMTSGFDHMRFINFAKVIEVDGEWQICIRDKEVFNMYEMFHTRYALHRKAYQHKTVQAVEIMLLEAMKAAEGTLELSTSIGDMDAYINRTDSIFHEILLSPGLENARKYLQNINKRKLHKCVGETCPITNPEIKKKDNETIKGDILKEVCVVDKLGLESFDFAVQTVKLDFGGGEKNPLKKLRFYTKDDKNNAVVCEPSQVSSMIPHEHFNEHLVRVFLLPTENKEINKKRTELLLSGFDMWCKKNKLEVKFPISSSTSTATKAPDRDSKRGGDPAGPAGSSSKVPRQVNP